MKKEKTSELEFLKTNVKRLESVVTNLVSELEKQKHLNNGLLKMVDCKITELEYKISQK